LPVLGTSIWIIGFLLIQLIEILFDYPVILPFWIE